MTTVARRSMPRRIERFLIGKAMPAIAWLLERALLRSAKRRGETGDDH
jgi:hypothetical protein